MAGFGGGDFAILSGDFAGKHRWIAILSGDFAGKHR
jgi:hypothetical protein